MLIFYSFLLVSIPWQKLVILGAMGFFNAGWYAILKANMFSAMPGKSGIAQALDNGSGMFGTLLPFGIGLPRRNPLENLTPGT